MGTAGGAVQVCYYHNVGKRWCMWVWVWCVCGWVGVSVGVVVVSVVFRLDVVWIVGG